MDVTMNYEKDDEYWEHYIVKVKLAVDIIRGRIEI